MLTTRDWVGIYLENGYWVIPTVRADKKPAIFWKEYQTVKPTSEEVDGWFARGDRNIGVICGGASGVVVIDADDAAAESWVRTNCGFSPFRVKTRKGTHFYYRHPGGHVQSKARVITGINVDVRGDGGLATGAGSIHDTGHVYCLDVGSDIVSVQDLPVYDPGWFPKPVITQPADRKAYEGMDRFDRAARYMDRIPGVGNGLRNQSAFQAAASVVRDFGLDLPQGMALMMEWNTRNDPPMPLAELEATVKSALASGRLPLGAKLA